MILYVLYTPSKWNLEYTDGRGYGFALTSSFGYYDTWIWLWYVDVMMIKMMVKVDMDYYCGTWWYLGVHIFIYTYIL